MSGIYIATPHTRAFEGQFVDSLLGITGAKHVVWKRLENQPIDFARNYLAQDFLKSTAYDYLLMCDSDATFSPSAIARLASRNLPVVSAVFFKRDIPPVPTIGVDVGRNLEGRTNYNFGYTMKKIIEYIPRTDPDGLKNEMVFDQTDKDIIEVDGVGQHFTMIRRDVLEALEKPYFYSFSDNAGEDFYFCQQVKKAGFKIYCDLSVYVGHIAGPGIVLGLKQFMMYMGDMDTDQIWEIGAGG